MEDNQDNVSIEQPEVDLEKEPDKEIEEEAEEALAEKRIKEAEELLKEEKKKKSKLPIIILIIILLIGLGIGGYFGIKKLSNKSSSNGGSENSNKNSGTVSNEEIAYVNYDLAYSYGFNCYDYDLYLQKRYTIVKDVKNDLRVVCLFNLNLVDNNNISKISADVEVSPYFELNSVNSDDSIEKKDNSNYSVTIKNPSQDIKNVFQVVFTVKDATKDDLSVGLKNVQFDTIDNKHYKIFDIFNSFEKTGIIKKYKTEYGYILAKNNFSYYDSNPSSFTFIDSYTCIDPLNCEAVYADPIGSSYNYYIIYDKTLKLYNADDPFIDSSMKEINLKYNDYDTYQVTFIDKKPIGILVSTNDNDNYSKYYLLGEGKDLTYKISNVNKGEAFLYAYRGTNPEDYNLNNYSFYDYYGNVFKGDADKLYNIPNTEYYIKDKKEYTYWLCCASFVNLIFDKDGNIIKKLGSFDYTILDNGNTTVYEDNTIKEYKDNEVVREIELKENEKLLDVFNSEYYLVFDGVGKDDEDEKHFVLINFITGKEEIVLKTYDVNDYDYSNFYYEYETNDRMIYLKLKKDKGYHYVNLDKNTYEYVEY